MNEFHFSIKLWERFNKDATIIAFINNLNNLKKKQDKRSLQVLGDQQETNEQMNVIDMRHVHVHGVPLQGRLTITIKK